MNFLRWKIWRILGQFLKNSKNRKLIFDLVSIIKEKKRIMDYDVTHEGNTTTIEINWD